MKERQVSPIELTPRQSLGLTTSAVPPRLERGVMNMPEPGNGEGANTSEPPQPTTTDPEQVLEGVPSEAIVPQNIREIRFDDKRLASFLKTYVDRSDADRMKTSRSVREIEGRIVSVMTNTPGLSPADIENARIVLDHLDDVSHEMIKVEEDMDTGRYFNINSKDLIELSKPGRAPLDWLDQQFDRLYRVTQSGREFDSPIVRKFENAYSEANQHLSYLNPEILEEFDNVYATRFNLLAMRNTIGYRSMENIQKTSFTLGTLNLMRGFSMENGQVATIVNRMQEVIDDARIANPDKHIDPQTVNKIIDRMIEEQVYLAKKGMSSFKRENKDTQAVEDVAVDLMEFATEAYEGKSIDQITRELTAATKEKGVSTEVLKERKERFDKWEGAINQFRRASRTAYDVLVTSQRLGVLVARGEGYRDLRSYFSDPAAGTLAVYNYEELALNKWNLLGSHDYELVQRLKSNLAEEWLQRSSKDLREHGYATELHPEQMRDLGTTLLREIASVADFFSSGWRVMGILNGIDDRVLDRRLYDAKREKLEQAGTPVTEDAVIKLKLDQDEEERIRAEAAAQAKNLGLFFRLRYTASGYDGPGQTPEGKKDVLGRIAKYRPEEIVRLFRDRMQNDKYLTEKYNKIFQKSDAAFDQFKLTPEEQAEIRASLTSKKIAVKEHGQEHPHVLKVLSDAEVNEAIERRMYERGYEKFKAKYGRALRQIREEGWKEYKAFDIGAANFEFTPEQRMMIEQDPDLGPGEAEKLKKIMAAMTEFAEQPKTIDDIIYYYRFAPDLSARTLNIDDGILFDLENEDLVDHAHIDKTTGRPTVLLRKRFIALSEQYASDKGGDGYVRAWNDTAAANNVFKGLQTFIEHEDFEKRTEGAMEAAAAATGYAGLENRARLIKHTVGLHLNLAKKSWFWDTVGLDKLPFRLSMSDLERIYGPGAHPLSREELRQQIDNISRILVANIAKLSAEQEEILRNIDDPDERERLTKEIIEHNKHGAHRIMGELENLLEITAGDIIKLRSFGLLLLLMLLAGTETMKLFKNAATGAAGGGGPRH